MKRGHQIGIRGIFVRALARVHGTALLIAGLAVLPGCPSTSTNSLFAPPQSASLVVTSISPPTGPVLGGITVTLTGTGFAAGASVKIGGTTCSDVEVDSGTSLTCTTGAHSTGPVDVDVNVAGQVFSLPDGFTYTTQPAPTILSVSPNTGSANGGTLVNVAGSGFVSGIGITLGGSDCSVVSMSSDNQLYCLTSAHVAGTVDAVAINPDAQTATLAGAFTYFATLSITGVSPVTGSPSGGTVITISGTEFQAGALVAVGGSTCTSVNVISPSQLTCVAPAHAVGPVSILIINPNGQSTNANGIFSYTAAPVVTSLTPTQGPTVGGTQLSIFGTNFLPGASVQLGTGVCSSVGVLSSTQITCTTTAQAQGVVGVTVTNADGQTSTLPSAYSFNPAPTITSINPSTGVAGGGTALTIIGTNFLSGLSLSLGGSVCTSTNVVSPTQVTCVAPAHPSGAVNVVVTNPDGQAATLGGGYTYQGAPTVTSVSPAAGPLAGGATIIVNGTAFLSGATVTLGGNNCASVNVVSSTQLTCVTPAHAAGAVNLVVTNPDTQTGTGLSIYTYQPAPTLGSILPAAGALAGGTPITLTGTGFRTGVSVELGGAPCTIATLSSTQITCASTSHPAGIVDVTVTNTDTQTATLSGAFTYEAGPVLSTVSPTSGPLAGTSLTLNGSGFLSGATVTIDGLPCGVVTVVSANQITCTAPAHAAGIVDITVTNQDNQASTLSGAFTYNPSPNLTLVSPVAGPLAGGTLLTLTGTNFQSGAAVQIGGNPCIGITVVSSTQITCTNPAHAAGSVDVQVTNADGQSSSLANSYSYDNAPTFTAITPNAGPLAGGELLTLTGTGFLSGASVSLGGTVCTSPVVISPTQLSCTAPAHAAGVVNVNVVNGDGQAVSAVGAFSYNAAPSITSVTPASGALAGGSNLTITGANFQSGATATLGGTACTISLVTSTQIFCATGVHASGTVSLTVTNPDGQSAVDNNAFAYEGPPSLSAVLPVAGPLAGGNVLSLSGTGFLSGATVSVGGAVCTVPTLLSSTLVTCTAPANSSGTYNVVITNADGQLSTLSSAYTYQPGPALSTVAPVAGTTSGGTLLTLNGSNFRTGVSVTVGGNACGSITLVSSNQLTCSSPAHAIGSVDVVVSNSDGQSATLSSAYTYQGPVSLTSVSPSAGALGGGTALSLLGSNFLTGMAVTIGGSSCNSVNILSSTQATCITPAHAAGAVDVTAANLDGQSSTLSSAYTYEAAPVIIGVTPVAGALAGGTSLTITGSGFVSGATIDLGGTACGSVSFVSATQMTCVTGAHAAATVSMTVTNPDHQIGTYGNAFTYEAAPTLASVSPNAGALGGGTSITLTGTGFLPGVGVSLGGNACTSVNLVSSTSINCLTPAHAAGTVPVIVTNPDSQSASLSSGFTYQGPPTVSGVSPSAGALAGGSTVTVSGTNFLSGAGVTFAGLTCSSVTVVSPTQITCTTPAHTAGAVTVTVTNPDTQSGSASNAYTYEPAPSLAAISPDKGNTGGGTLVTLSGNNFLSGASVTLGGLSCSGVSVVSPSQLTCSTPSHAAGTVDVAVTNLDGQSALLTGGYTFQGPPTVSGVAPSAGALGGGTPITVTGTGFLSGASVSFGGSNCASTIVVSSTQITCTTTAHVAGTVTVSVTNTDSQTGSATNAYAYEAAPNLISLSPTAGSLFGNTSLTLTGTGFISGASVTIGGAACTSTVVVSSSQINCKTPAHVAGSVDVGITNPDSQASTLTGGFTYQAAPTLSGVSPAAGPLAGGTLITLTGTNFLSGVSATVGGAACTSPSLLSSTQMTCFTPAHAAGAANVVVSNSDGQNASLSGAFTYNPAPTITSISPGAGALAGGSNITLAGTGFISGATVSLGGSACTVSLVTSTEIFCSTGSHAAGVVSATVANPDGQTGTLSSAYTYEAAPTVASVSPTAGPLAGGTTLTVTGTGFLSGASVTVGGLACASVSVLGPTQLTCAAPAHGAGTVDVTVTNTDTQSGTATNAYVYQAGPALTSLSPTSGPLAGGGTLTLSGSNFLGSTVTLGGVTCGSVNVVSSSQITCTVPAHAAGSVDVKVTNSDGQSSTLSSSFTYQTAPSVTSISPVAGALAGGTTLTLVGTGFLSGATVSAGGSPCNSVAVFSPTQLTCVTSSHVAGSVDIVATNADGQNGTLSSAYTYEAAPAVTSISPTGGPVSGGSTLTLTGTGFLSGASVSVGGTTCTTPIVVSSTQLTCIIPAHAAGTVGVTVVNPDTQSSTLAGSYTYNAAPSITSISPTGGSTSGGTSLIINGANFQAGATASLGGTSCTISLTTSTQIFCTTALHAAGAVDLTVTNPDGQNTTSSGIFTYRDAPTVTAILPVAGALAGGTSVTITGTGFLSGASITLGGTTCTSPIVVSPTEATCVTGAHAAGSVNVVVTNPDNQFGTLTNGYTYQAAPTLTTISPASGTPAGGNTLTLNGNNFLSTPTVKVGGQTCGSVNLVSSSQLTCVVPAHAVGAVDVSVSNPDGQTATLTSSYTYVGPPSLTSLSPIGGPTAGGTSVTLTGGGFQTGASVTFGGTACGSIVVVSATQITCNAPAHAAGSVDVSVVNPDTQGTTLTSAYKYSAPPTVTSLSPTAGPLAGGQVLSITGTGFQSGATVTLGNTTVGFFTCTSPNVASSTSISCLTPAHAAITIDVNVTNPDGQTGSLPNAYTYQPVPTLSSITPTIGSGGGGTTLTLNGSNFQTGLSITIGGTGCTSATLINSSQATCVTPSKAAGTYDVILTNTDGQSATLTSAYTYPAIPTVTSISPTLGSTSGGTQVTVGGTNFVSGDTVNIGGTCNSVSVLSPTQLTCITSAHSAGNADVKVNSGYDVATLTSGYTFTTTPAPTVTAISPVGGPLTGGTPVTLTGTGYQSGATVAIGGLSCNGVNVVSATQITCNTVAHAAGNVDVTVTNPDTQFGTLAAGFAYQNAPTLTSVSPTSGALAGGGTLTLIGTGFVAGASISIGGTACTSPTVVSQTQATCLLPAKSAGIYSVTFTNADTRGGTLNNAYTYQAAPSITSLFPTAGSIAGNTSLTVNGTGFLPGSTVSLGGSTCNVTVGSATEILCTTTAHAAGSVVATVTNPDGQIGTSSYTYMNAPTVVSLSPAGGPLGGGGNTNIFGTNFVSPTSVTIGGSACSSVAFNNSGWITCSGVPPHAAGAADVVVTNPDGETATLSGGYLYAVAPLLSSISPPGANPAGGGTLTLTGTGFQSGATVTVGSNPCANPVYTSATQMSCTIPAGTLGTYSVTITNPDTQISTLPNSFVYANAPTLASLTPSAAPLAGGTNLTLTGTGFQTGATVSIGGTACASPSVVSSTTLTCTSPAKAAGNYNVTVTNLDGQSYTLPNSLLYNSGPTLASISPNAGSGAGGTSVTLNGSGFLAGLTVAIGGTPCASPTLVSSTQATCVTGAKAAGTYDVVLTNPDSQSATLTGGYTYPNIPTLTAVSPSAGSIGGGTQITLTGTNFASGDSVKVGGNPCLSLNVIGATQMTCITSAHAAGNVDVVVSSAFDNATLAGGFNFTVVPAPTVSAISPVGGSPSGGTAVILTGTGFTSGATVALGGISCSGVSVVSATQITCTTGAHALGTVDVVVTNADTQTGTLAAGFAYQPAPTLTAISPTAGALAGGGTLSLTGTGFVAGASINVGGTSCVSVNVLSATSATCVLPAKTAGTYDVTFLNADTRGATLNSSYTYQSAPSVTSVSPGQGPITGNTSLTVNGSNFINGAAVSISGAPCSVTVSSATQIICTTSAHSSGTWNVSVTNPDGQIGTLASAFIYMAAPALTSISPSSGPLAGGGSVTVFGSNIYATPSITLGGTPCPVTSSSSSWAVCTPAAHAAGVVDVILTNPDAETASLLASYTYQGPPSLASISPGGSNPTGGGTLTLNGTGFQAGIAVTIGATPCGSPTLSGSTQITCTIPPKTAGTYDVTVTNLDAQSSTLPSAFIYAPAPTLTSISPAGGPASGGTSLTLTGTGFESNATVKIGSVICTSPTVVSSTQMTCVAPAQTLGVYNVTVTNPDNQFVTNANAYTYQASPTLSGIVPSAGPLTGGTSVTISGNNFAPGATVTIAGTTCASPTVASNQITCTTGSHAAGAGDVVVTDPSGQNGTLTAGYTYQAAPAVSTVSPTGGPLAGGNLITLTGTGFVSGAAVTIGGTSCSGVNVTSSTSLNCTAPAHAAGTVNIVVTNADTQTGTLSSAYTYEVGPTLSGVSPAGGSTFGNTSISLTGTGFISGATVSVGGSACTSVVVSSPTAITCLTPMGSGTVNIVVTNPDSQNATLTGAYTFRPAPAIVSVSPPTINYVGGTSVTLSGSGFVSGATVTIGGSPCTSPSVLSATQMTCSSPALTNGSVNTVVVTNTDAQFGSLTNAFTAYPSPTLTSISPNPGPTAGGTAVTLVGTNFGADLAVSIGGNSCASVSVVNNTQANCTLPAHSAGTVSAQVSTGAGSNLYSNFFTYNPAPGISFVSPTGGSLAGGGTLTITGSNFVSGATINVGGNACTSPNFVNASTLTCTLSSHVAGSVTVTVTNPDGQLSSLNNGYTYEPAPTLTSVSPNSGRSTGGTTVTLTGTGFLTGATVTAAGLACTSPNVTSSTSMTCVTPAHAAGAVTFVVTNIDGQTGTLASAYTYVPGPTVSAISPVGGPPAGGTSVTITGTNFQTGATATLGGNPCTSPTVVSSTSLTCVSPAGASGSAVDVVVTNPDTQTGTLTASYTYRGAPTVAAISPAVGQTSGANAVTLTGTGFVSGATVAIGGVAATSVVIVSSTQITAVTGTHAAGVVDVVVTNVDTQTGTLTGGFTYSGSATPTVTTISPSGGNTSGGTALSISGTNFSPGATVTVGGNTCTSVNVVSSTAMSCTTPAGSTGPATVVVTNPDNQTASYSSFNYAPAPTVLSISPTVGTIAGGTLVGIVGTGFQSGATVSIGGSACTGVVTASPWTNLSCTTTSNIAGTYNVVVTNPDGQFGSLSNGYTYQTPPSVTSISPNTGDASGGETVTISGTNFLSGASVTIGTTACDSVSVVSSSSITCVTGSSGNGTFAVKVTNPSGISASLSSAFTYTTAPHVTSISPAYGPPAGGTSVTINGTAFETGASVTVGGVAATSVVVVSQTQITAVTGAHAVGFANVTVTNTNTLSGTLSNGFDYTANPAPTISGVSPNSGVTSGGTVVTITGTGFQSGATIKLGGTSCASVSYISSTSLSCTTPAGSGSVDFTVTNPDLQTVSTTGGVYTYYPNPSVLTVNPNIGPLAGGTTITIGGSGFQTGMTVTIGGYLCGSTNVVSSTSITCVTPSRSGGSSPISASITVTASDGRTGTLSNAFTYEPAPTLIGIYPDYGSTSGSNQVTLLGTSFLTGATVTIGGQACTAPTLVAFNKMTCYVPAGSAGVDNVVLTNPDSQSVTLASGYTYGSSGPGFTSSSMLAGVRAQAGYLDGTSAARFNSPRAAISDGTYLYVIDSANSTIRKVTISTGAVTTLAGTPGVSGCSDGIGATARFGFGNAAANMAYDGTYLYLPDSACNTIRRVDPSSGSVTTLAGNGSCGGSNGVGTSASFCTPTGVAYVAGSPNMLYVTDPGLAIIRSISLSTLQTATIAGVNYSCGSADGTGTAATFCSSTGITSDGTNLYIADGYGHSIRQMVISTKVVTTIAGAYNANGYSDNVGTLARFGVIYGLQLIGTQLYITDSGNQAIRLMDLSTGSVTTYAGGNGAGYADGSQSGNSPKFYTPVGIAYDGTNFYVTDNGNNFIREISPGPTTVSTLVGSNINLSVDGTGSSARFGHASNIAYDGTYLYIADATGPVIRKMDPSTGQVTTFAGTIGQTGTADGYGASALFAAPTALTTDGVNLYVGDATSCTIRQINISSQLVSTIAGRAGTCSAANGTGTGAGFAKIASLSTDGHYLYVSELWNGIRKVEISTGITTTVISSPGGWGDGGVASATDGTYLYAAGANSTSTLYYYSDYIYKINLSNSTYSLLAGSSSGNNPLDGTGSSAYFYDITQMTTDGVNLYVSEREPYNAGNLRKIDVNSGAVTTLSTASFTTPYSDTDGALSNTAKLILPTGIFFRNNQLFWNTGTGAYLAQ